MNPQFVVDGAGAWGGVNIDGVISRLLSVPIQHGSPVGRHPHGVDEFVEIANHVFVFVDVEVLAQHPVGEGLNELGSLVAVQAGENGRGELLEVGHEGAFGGVATDFDFIKPKAELLGDALSLSLEGACIFIKGGCTLGAGGFFVFVFRDVDDQLAFVVSDIGCTLGDLGASVAAVFSSSCVNFCSLFIVKCCHLFSPGTGVNLATLYKELKITNFQF